MVSRLSGMVILLCSLAEVTMQGMEQTKGTGTYTNVTVFEGNGYAQFSSNFSVGENFTIRLVYKSNVCNGVLLYAQASPSREINDHLVLQLIDGQVQFEFNNADHNIIATLVAPPNNTTQFCDGRWQSLVATKTRRTAYLYVDGAYSTVSSGGSLISADTDGTLYLGGVPDDLIILQATNMVKAHFTGLLSNVQFLNDKGVLPITYEHAVALKGIQRNETKNYIEDPMGGDTQATPSQGTPPSTGLLPCDTCQQYAYSLHSPLVVTVITLGTLNLALCLLCSVVTVLLICSRRKRNKVNYCHKLTLPPEISISQTPPLATVPAPHIAMFGARLGVSSHISTCSSTGSCIYVEPMAYDDRLGDGADTHIYENQSMNVYQTLLDVHTEAKRHSFLNKAYDHSLKVPVKVAWAPGTVKDQSAHEDKVE